MKNSWFLIANPTSGNGKLSKKWEKIQQKLNENEIQFSFKFSEYPKHEIKLVHEAIADGFTNIISVGGDGTLHNVVNGVMTQNNIKTTEINIGVIPLGTGNDWIKTYNIPNNIGKSIEILAKQKTTLQDIGFLKLENTTEYFNNIAGIGYDAYVAREISKHKRFGVFSYFIGAVIGTIKYNRETLIIETENETIETKSLMVLMGIGYYFSGGMKLIDPKIHKKGFFKVTVVKDFTSLNIITNFTRLFNGKVLKHKKVETLNSTKITITPPKDSNVYIEADGEIIGSGKVTAKIIKEALNFCVA